MDRKPAAADAGRFREMWATAYPKVAANALLMKLIGRLRVTNIVATINLNVCEINLSRIAAEHPFCNYHRGTFAAMGVRIPTPKCSALIYPAGVVVCMGTQCEPDTYLAALKYVEVLNDPIGIDCEMTGVQMDNFVCSVYTFSLDLEHGIRPEWTNVIEYDGDKFPGAIVRCKFMGLPVDTNVHMALFRSGKINITGARSLYEALYVFVCFYYQYLVHMRLSTRMRQQQQQQQHAIAAPSDQQPPPPEVLWKTPAVVKTEVEPAVVEDHQPHLLRYMHRLDEERRAGLPRPVDVKIEDEAPPGAARRRPVYVAQHADGTQRRLDVAGLEGVPDDARDLLIATAATNAEIDMPWAESVDF